MQIAHALHSLVTITRGVDMAEQVGGLKNSFPHFTRKRLPLQLVLSCAQVPVQTVSNRLSHTMKTYFIARVRSSD